MSISAIPGSLPPTPGIGGVGPLSAPPPVVPLTFLALSAAGFLGFAGTLALGADEVIDNARGPDTVAIVHLGVLAFLSVAVLGALHQFAPVVGGRALRSVVVARVTAVVFFAGAVALPTGFAHGPESLVMAGGVCASVGVALAAWNLSRPLAAPHKGAPMVGIRFSVGFLVATAAFGVVYAFNRSEGWFPLYTHRVLAHAHLGLLGWLGLTYVAVAEKLWPMFLLAHRPRARAGAWAVRLIPLGVVLFAPGLLFDARPVALAGGAIVIVGVGAHVVSLASVIRHRRRRLELLHAYVVGAALALAVAMILGMIAALADVSTLTRTRLVSGEVAALFGWITLAVIGHAHKVVPFISWMTLRRRGATTRPDGKPLLFADLFDRRVARTTCIATVAGVVLLVFGTTAGSTVALQWSALAFAVSATSAFSNLVIGPRRVLRAHTDDGGVRSVP